MKLLDYLVTYEMPKKRFAALIKVSRNGLYKYLGGKCKPGPEVIKRIFFHTGGKVSREDF